MGDSHSSAWAMSQRRNLDEARPKTWQILATSSCEMPLNQQLGPATFVSNTQIITVKHAGKTLVGL